MIKGAQRRIIVLKGPLGKYFDQAYFIVKDEYFFGKNNKKDMVKEAIKAANDAILMSETEEIKSAPAKKSRGFWLFLAGVLIGCAACVIIAAMGF
jgi:hypothetical protein